MMNCKIKSANAIQKKSALLKGLFRCYYRNVIYKSRQVETCLLFSYLNDFSTWKRLSQLFSKSFKYVFNFEFIMSSGVCVPVYMRQWAHENQISLHS